MLIKGKLSVGHRGTVHTTFLLADLDRIHIPYNSPIESIQLMVISISQKCATITTVNLRMFSSPQKETLWS